MHLIVNLASLQRSASGYLFGPRPKWPLPKRPQIIPKLPHVQNSHFGPVEGYISETVQNMAFYVKTA